MAAVSGGEEQAAVRVDAGDGGGDFPFIIYIARRDVEVHQVREVLRFGVDAGLQVAILLFDADEKTFQEWIQLVLFAREEGERGGVGYPIGEECLVDVEANATDGRGKVRGER